MAKTELIEYEDASPEVRAVYDDIMAKRKVDWVNNFWKALAQHPPTMRRLWSGMQEVMAPGALEVMVKEMLYLAVSITNNCEYCIHSHMAAARRAGMTDAMLGELMAVVGMASQTNALANAHQVEPDPVFLSGAAGAAPPKRARRRRSKE